MTSSSFKPLTLGATAVAALLLGACSTTSSGPMDAGERMSARGETIAGRGAAWTQGQREIAEGEQLVSKSASNTASAEKRLERAQEAAMKAEQQILAAQADRASGERMIAGGTVRMREAEAAYSDIRSGPSALPLQ